MSNTDDDDKEYRYANKGKRIKVELGIPSSTGETFDALRYYEVCVVSLDELTPKPERNAPSTVQSYTCLVR